jgi:organizing structure protein 2
VGVATLSGSILSRNRTLPTRFLLPPLFLLLSAQHFLPKTTHNLSDYLGSLEDEYLPSLAQKHETAKAHSAMAWARVKDASEGINGKVERAAVSAFDKVQEVTGLKLRETFGRQRAISAEIKSLKAEAGRTAQESSKVEEKTK